MQTFNHIECISSHFLWNSQEKFEETDSSDAVKFIELTLKFNVQIKALENKF